MPFASKLRDLRLQLPLVIVLEQPKVFLSLLRTQIEAIDEEVCQLVWPEVRQDAQVYYEVFRQFWLSAADNDEDFIGKFSENTRYELAKAQIFKSLASENIILSQAHRAEGLNSQQHAIIVLEKIITEQLPVSERFLMRIFALMHDHGKMLVAGYEGDVTQLIIDVGKGNQDGTINASFIDHQMLSALILQSLFDHEAELGKLISAKDLAYLLCLIEHHHNFGRLNKTSVNPIMFNLEEYFSRIPELAAQDRWRYLLHSFLFSVADIAATKGHWHYLPENIERFENLLEFYYQQSDEADIDLNFLALCQQSIALVREKYAYILNSLEFEKSLPSIPLQTKLDLDGFEITS